MINLNIINQRQILNSSTCGSNCVKMILDYLGIEKSFDEVCKLCNQSAQGTLETDLALAFQSVGISSMLYLIPDGETIWAEYVNMPVNKVVSSLKRRAGKAHNCLHRRGFTGTAQAMESGLVTIKVITRDLIQAELDKGNPWIVAVGAYPLYGWKNKKQKNLLHFVIIQGYEGNNFIVNDPAADTGGIYQVHCDHLMYCLYNTDGGAICVKKPNDF